MNKLAHAILVHGSPGWGETELATSIAEHFIGLGSGELNAESAQQFAHPDFHWLQPEAPGKQIKVDQIRSLRNFVLQTCQKSDRKVAVIIDAHMMNKNAANALLKTLEEPPGECLLVLSTDSHQDLLPTIRSRCQSLPILPRYDSANIDWIEAALENELSGSAPMATGELDVLLFEFGYAPLFVLQAIQQGEKGLLPDLVSCVGAPGQFGKVVKKWLDKRQNPNLDKVLSRWMRYLHVLLRVNSKAVANEKSAVKHVQPLIQVLAEASSVDLLAFCEELRWARRLLHSTSNANQTLLLERLLLKWSGLV